MVNGVNGSGDERKLTRIPLVGYRKDGLAGAAKELAE